MSSPSASGGGSIVSDDGADVGPRSVGYRIADQARIFGRSRADRDRHRRRPSRPRGSRRHGRGPCHRARRGTRAPWRPSPKRSNARVERCRLSPRAGPGDRRRWRLDPDAGPTGRSRRRPARATSAWPMPSVPAIAQVSGEVDRITDLEGDHAHGGAGRGRDRGARSGRRGRGPCARRSRVIEREDVPLAYLPGKASRIRVRVVGDLGGRGMTTVIATARQVTPDDIMALEIGAGILGTGRRRESIPGPAQGAGTAEIRPSDGDPAPRRPRRRGAGRLARRHRRAGGRRGTDQGRGGRGPRVACARGASGLHRERRWPAPEIGGANAMEPLLIAAQAGYPGGRRRRHGPAPSPRSR